MIKSMAMVFVSASLVASMPASAHTEEYFDSHAAPHGGQMRMAGPYHLELVAKEKELELYVTDHGDTKINTEGGVGKATIQAGKAKPKTTIKLEPTGDNMFKGAGDFTLTPDTVIVVFIKLPEQEAQSTRFTPLKPKAKDGKKSGEDHSGHDHHMHQDDKKPAEDHSGHDSHHMHH
ncbi:hypothetical protein [Nitrosovibrio sp. Nv6]|uniref:hypothetical protein n=1 Tax=Nitrosovibrio sp. Nv6 TaxID=1855340 RepID=UPI0008C23843|nr:hypothetical protein [Nitrosovibrio sp. Nv6]SEP40420.1 hypothetical protein SAMN05216316_2844 [Nitrosovibrio sp. Nv6]